MRSSTIVKHAGRHKWRKMKSISLCAMCGLAAGLAALPLGLVLLHLFRAGLGALDLAFFTHLPQPVGVPGGGMANAIVGSFMIVGMAAVAGVPVGVFGALYLSEYASAGFRRLIRFVCDILNGVPSIVWGITVYALIVLKMGRFSALAGAAALAFIMIPLVLRTTEEMLNTIPNTYREAGAALGIPKWRITLHIVLQLVRGGVVTGVLLAVARVAGETAPLLFTAFGNQFWNWDPTHPTAALPLQIFAYAISPYEDWHRQAWAGALVLLVFVLGINVAIRIVTRRAIGQK